MNRNVFSTPRARSTVPAPDTRNEAGGAAYKRTAEAALAQYAVTGTISTTFYADAETQLDKTLELARAVSTEYLAKTAVFARQRHMKDMPALLCAVLVTRSEPEADSLFWRIARDVLDDLKMVSNFVQVLRSGRLGSKSLPRVARRYVAAFLAERNPERLLNDDTGVKPGLADLIKIVHPKPKDAAQQDVFAYFLGREIKDIGNLPVSIKSFELFKSGQLNAKARAEILTNSSINFRRLDSLGLSDAEWTLVARNASWHTLRMNLATFGRHNVYKDDQIVRELVGKLTDAKTIARVRVFPYQLYVAHRTVKNDTRVPGVLANALQTAFEIACDNVPKLPGKVALAVDISGSMSAPVTGSKGGGQGVTAVTCADAGSLGAATLLHANQDAIVFRFDTVANEVRLNPRDSVFTNASKLTGSGGGTACSSPVRRLLDTKQKVDFVVIFSDNESWADSQRNLGQVWGEYRRYVNPSAKLICVDLAPHASVQAPDLESAGIYHIGGFSDAVFEHIWRIARNENAATWEAAVRAVALPE